MERHQRVPLPSLEDLTSKGYQAQRNVLSAQVYLRRRSLFISKILFFFFLFLLTFSGVAIYAMYYRVKRKYQCFIDQVDKSSDFSMCSGIRLAFCAEYKWFNMLFACNSQTMVAEAAVYAFYSKDLHPKVCKLGIGTFLNTIISAISLAETQKSVQELICIGLNIKPDDQDAQQCYPTCKWQDNIPGMTGWDVANSSLSSGANYGMMGAMMGGPIGGAIGFLAGALGGAFFGGRKLQKEKEQAKEQCEAARTSCYVPPGLPACRS